MMIESDDLGDRIKALRDGGIRVVLEDVLKALDQIKTRQDADFPELMYRIEHAARYRITYPDRQ